MILRRPDSFRHLTINVWQHVDTIADHAVDTPSNWWGGGSTEWLSVHDLSRTRIARLRWD